MEPESLSEALHRLSSRGFAASLYAHEGKLRDAATGVLYDPELLHVAEVVRFEGASDPDEQAILFALRSPTGAALGTYTSVYGPQTPAADGEVVRKLGAKP